MKALTKVGAGLTAAMALTSTFAFAGTSIAAAHPMKSVAIPKGIHLTVWSWWTGPELTVERQLAAKWAKAHGDTVSVVAQTQTFQFFATAARTGKGPDVIFGMPHDNNGTFQEEGLLAPIPTLNPKLYNPYTIEAVTIAGREWAYPISVQSIALFYNKKLIPTPPRTWAQFVKDANKHGFAFAQHNFYYDYAYVGGMGGYVFKDNHGTLDPNNIGLANKGSIAAFTLIRDMDAKYHWMNPNTKGTIAVSEFEAGRIGMILDGPWDVPNMQKAKIDLGVARIPSLPNGHPATPFLGVITAAVSSRSHYIPASQSLAQYLANAGQMGYFRVNADLPALLSLQRQPVVQHNPLDAGFISALKYAYPMPNIPQMQDVWNADTIMVNIIKGSISPAKGAAQFVKNIKTGIAVTQG